MAEGSSVERARFELGWARGELLLSQLKSTVVPIVYRTDGCSCRYVFTVLRRMSLEGASHCVRTRATTGSSLPLPELSGNSKWWRVRIFRLLSGSNLGSLTHVLMSNSMVAEFEMHEAGLPLSVSASCLGSAASVSE